MPLGGASLAMCRENGRQEMACAERGHPFAGSFQLAAGSHNEWAMKMGSRRWDMSSTLSAAPAAVVIFVCSVMPLAWMAAAVLTNPVVRSEFSMDWFRWELLGRTIG